MLPLFATTDPLLTDALFMLEIDASGGGNLTDFQPAPGVTGVTWTVGAASPPPPPTGVPEPSTPWLLLAGLACVAWFAGVRPTQAVVGKGICALAALLVFGVAEAQVIRVTPSGGSTRHDGQDWGTAYAAHDLQFIIDHNPGAEFWLARGGYGDVQNVRDGTRLYGGFVGFIETSRDQRDPALNTTILGTVTIVPIIDKNGNESAARTR